MTKKTNPVTCQTHMCSTGYHQYKHASLDLSVLIILVDVTSVIRCYDTVAKQFLAPELQTVKVVLV